MTKDAFYSRVRANLDDLRADGLEKPEWEIASQQAAEIIVTPDGAQPRKVLNFCANNYLGLANHPDVIAAARDASEQWGAGAASVRFICGTMAIHKELERATAAYLNKDDAILFAAAFDANGAVFEPLFGPDDAIISDSLNHASIIDGVRLCKAKRYRFKNSDMADLEAQLVQADKDGAQAKIIVTDGVFSMDGYFANLKEMCDLADRFGALVMVDDCHATGFIGPEGRGTPALHGVEDRVDIITGTYGKALGGAMGGFVAARKEIVAWLRQRARPYLFSNTLAPAVAGASLKAIELARKGDALRERIGANAAQFRAGMADAGFDLLPGSHPIIPVMLGDAKLAQTMAARMLEEGIYVIGFSYPVVPQGQARIRTQMSAAHSPEHVDQAIATFTKVGRELGVAP